VRHTLELLICSCIGCYCLSRCWALLPLAIAELQTVVMAIRERQRVIDAAVEEE